MDGVPQVGMTVILWSGCAEEPHTWSSYYPPRYLAICQHNDLWVTLNASRRDMITNFEAFGTHIILTMLILWYGKELEADIGQADPLAGSH